MSNAIRVLRLPVVLPIALVLVVLLPLWEFCGWFILDKRLSWSEVSARCIKVIARFVWPAL